MDAWTSLPPLDLLLLLAPVALAVVTVLLPGRGVARTSSLLLAGLMLPLPEFNPPGLRIAWCVLWIGVAMISGTSRQREWRRDTPRPGGFESGLVGLLLAAVLFVILVVGVGRQDLPPESSRRASLGLLTVAAGIAHLMLRRDALRATVSFATLGLGLQWLERAAADSALEGSGLPLAAVPLATAVAVALAARAAVVRQHDAGSAWVSHAHDLHD